MKTTDELFDELVPKVTGYGELRLESTPTGPNPFSGAVHYMQQLARSTGQLPVHLVEGEQGSYAITAENDLIARKTVELLAVLAW